MPGNSFGKAFKITTWGESHGPGVGVVIEAAHFCMMMRGVQKQNSRAVTSCMLGRFKSDARTRAEFLNFIRD